MNVKNGNLCLLWGYTSVVVALLVGAVGLFSTHPGWNFLWFLIWIIGGTLSHRVEKGCERVCSDADRISSGLWRIVGYCILVGVALCLYFMLFWGSDCWTLMFIIGLLVVGIATSIQGVILAERSLIWGGGVGMLSGGIVTCCVIAGIPLLAVWVIPLFIVSFVCMMIVPGHILNSKAKGTN